MTFAIDIMVFAKYGKVCTKRTDKYLKNYQLKRNFDVQLAKNKFLQLMYFSHTPENMKLSIFEPIMINVQHLVRKQKKISGPLVLTINPLHL